jgi:hypothetical protein
MCKTLPVSLKTTHQLKQSSIILTLFFWTTLAFGQKFIVKDNDTLTYQETMEIREKGDTVYLVSCRTFEKINGQIVNQTDEQCLRQGLWTIPDSSGNYWTGIYHNNNQVGIWKRFDKNGKVLTETEEVSFGKYTYKVKEIDYTGGHPVTVIDKPFLSLYLKNFMFIVVLLMLTFLIKLFINNTIYNRENGSNLSPFYVGTPFTKEYFDYALHFLTCSLTIWIFNYKPENRRLVKISNTLTTLMLTIFFGTLLVILIFRK